MAGLVRGFSGFGTAMIFLPLAGQVLGPFAAITALVVMDLAGPLPNVPRALRDGAPGDVWILLAGFGLALPLGYGALRAADPAVFRYAVSAVSLGALGLLLAGLRLAGPIGRRGVLATGGASGFLAGFCGIAGPPVILFYMARPLPVAVIRANVLLFLLASDVLLLGGYAVGGTLSAAAVWTGLALIPPYMLANIAGAAIFRPDWDRGYRAVAYAVIAGSALMGLPLWD